ncbi:acyl-CoA dehydrogenase family protein [Kyrpidia tusciae]|uniref:Acyl-CoA dehydrogenase domain protein n=1 Tax=Kyrpidia tusciae (strain DSM 2912 / NBRC 15312 / T2) TaxID=562970 RepID=D5WXI3_KYRT2|nr:acyl-CoA dehydrogenase family protein [Kyrpidia tusciae]ADG05904.1 acyl-CoA dehydrogenase domain protein [Kyrpidia tusciae DSM 2912]
MFDFSPTPEQQSVLDRTNEIMERYIYPAERDFHEEEGLPEEKMRGLQKRVKEAGLWAPHLPKEAGGLGMGYVTLGLMNEILGRSPIAPRAFGTNAPDTGNQEILWLAGTQAQKERYLKPSVAGEIYTAFAMTEPEVSGSDPTLLRTTARRDGDGWVIDGHKWFATGGSRAAFFIVMAVTDPDADPHRRASMFIVEAGTPGLEIVRDVPVMGDTLGGHTELWFRNCRIPGENLLGEVGDGFRLAQLRLGPGRITHAMRWIGVMRRSFEMMLDYVQRRETRGQKLADFQTVQNDIAESYADIETSRFLTLHAAWKMDQGLDARKEISLIKFYGANALHRVIDRAIQVHGALGFSKDTPLEGFYREARAARIYDGADEVHRVVVAKRIMREFRERRSL